jgi:glycosyltransferase involved in cell wall biosynthesis
MDLTRSTFGITPNRSVVIHNPGAQVPSYLPDIPDLPSNFVLYAGRVCRLKGADILARAMRNVMAKRPNIHLVYVGGLMNADGRPMSDHIREIVGPQLSERVHFLGHVSREKVLTCMTRAKVFAYPSHLEGFPFVILEAMSCGAPVVYTKYPPGPEIIDDGVNGLLADPASPEDFSEKISRILDNPSFSYQLGENARRRVVEQFSVDKCVEATERFYEACLKTGSSPNRVGGM